MIGFEGGDRQTKLETQVAHLERFVEQLNEVIIEQNRRLDGLQRTIQEQDAQLSELKRRLPETKGTPEEERPPHY